MSAERPGGSRIARSARELPLEPTQVPVRHGRVGVLIVNLGTPESTSVRDIRRYLREFLSDRRVVEIPPLIWQPILNLIVLTFRPSRSARAYRSIWLKESNESPLRKYTRDQAERLRPALEQSGVLVDWAMRYGTPSMESRLKHLTSQGCDRILVMALYPQYSASTNASVYDKAFEALKKMRNQPSVRTAPPYYDDPLYIEALALSVEKHLDGLGWTPQVLLTSFHGLPKQFVDKGDPYYDHCVQTVRLLRERLGMSEEQLRLTFQSRFGRTEWIRPYTDETIRSLAANGIKSLAVVTPGFAADCLETLEEIGIAARETFLEHGGQHFSVVPCLNASNEGIAVLERVIRRELQGWI